MLNQQDMAFHRYIWQLPQSKRKVQILEGLFFQLRMAMMDDTRQTGEGNYVITRLNRRLMKKDEKRRCDDV